MVEKNLKKILNFLCKIFEKIKPRFSFHYVAYTTLFIFIIFSVVGLVQATTPNPGHPWIELGDGVFSVTNNQTALRTYTFPDANATVLTTNSAVTVAQGGTGITSIADGDLLVTTGANTFGTLTIGAGQSVRRNSGGTAFEAFTPSTGTVTGVSVVTANGFAGSVTSGATPAITITTSVSGMLKGNGTAISAATDGTDFLSPSTGWKLDGQTLGAKKALGSTDAYDIGFLTNNSERMTILSDGKVGIGTTTPTQKLSIAGGSIYLADTYGITWSNGSESIYGLGSAGSYSLQFNTYTGSSLTEKMRILGSGNVGIGTTNPGKKLSVQGDGVGHASSASGQFEITGTTEPLNKISFGIADNANDSTTYGYIFAAKQGISYRNLILNGLGGSVGIGTTNPTNTLSFGGDVDRTIGMERLSTNNYGKSLTISAGGGGASGTDNFGGDLYLKSGFSTGAGTSAIHFFTQTAGTTGITDRTTTEKMTILGSGYVGIGTTSPVSALHVNNASPYLAISSTDTVLSADENVGSLVFYSNDASANSSGGVGAIRSFVTSEYNTASTPSYMSFYTHANSTGPNGSVVGGAGLLERMRIDSAGNVGIGTTAPGSKLQVEGDISLNTFISGSTVSKKIGLGTSTGALTGHWGGIEFRESSGNDQTIHFWTSTSGGASTEKMTILRDGSVGIGITNPSSYTLQVSGTGGFTTSVNSPIFQGQAAAVTFGNASYASTIAGSALTISPTSWTATPTISGLITATSGITSNGTATFNGVTNIGDGGDAIAVNSNTWDISSAGAVTGVTTLATSGKITQGGYLNLTNDNLLHNGDFETNSLDGWNVAGAGTTTVVTGGYAGNYTSQFSGSVSFASDDYIPVDPTRDVIQLDAYVQKTVAGTTPGTLYFGYYAYNASKTVITTAPCGSYCYFAASGYAVPVDSAWHKFSATTTGEGTSYPNFPVGTKYIRVLALVNYNGSLDSVTLIDHISVKKINNGPLFVGNNFSASNLLDQHQVSKIYTTSGNILTFEPSSGGTINLNSATSNPISLTTSNNNHLNLMPNGTGRIGIGTTTPTAILHLKAGTATASTAPLKFTSGTNLTSAEAGAMEYDGTNLYFTPSGTTRKTIAYTSDLTSGYIPYTGGTSNVDLGVHNLTVDTTTLFVDATNHRVGVGTTGPTQKLDIIGAIKLSDTENDTTNKNSMILGRQYSSVSESEGFALVYGYSNSATNQLVLGGGNSSYNAATSVNFYTAANNSTRTGSERMRIDSAGNVGIGTTSPISKLQLGNNWTANPGSTNTIYLGSSGFAVSNIAPEQIITTNSTSTTPGSNIGLSLHNSTATAGAYAPLLVFSTMETGATSYNGAISAIGSRTVTGSGAGGNYIDGEMMFYTAPTAGSGLLERMRISESGKVGIGITAPLASLDVYGNTRIGKTVNSIGKTLTLSGNMTFDPVANPTNAQVQGMGLANGGAGNIPAGTYYYAVQFYTAEGDTGTAGMTYSGFPSIVLGTSSQVNITNIPVSSDPRVTGRKIYRSQTGSVGDYYYLYNIGSIANNTATTFTDNTAIATTSGDWMYNKVNTTAGVVYNGSIKTMQMGDALTAVGYNAFGSITRGSTSAAFGSNAMSTVTTGNSNNAFGHNAGYGLTTGSNNNHFGYAAGQGNQTGNTNASFGEGSLRNNNSYSYTGNAAFGTNSLYELNASNNYNVGFGYNAGAYAQGSYGTYLGYFAGSQDVTRTVGAYNIVIGSSAGRILGTGTDNIIIGRSVELATPNTNFQINIGNLLYGTGWATGSTPATSGKIGIGLTTPTAVLHLKAGTATASTAPLKFTSGTNLTTAEAGAMEYDGTRLYFTPASTRETLAFTSDLTSGYIPYTGGTSNVDLGVHNFTVDTTTLFVDATNHRVGVGTTTPDMQFTVKKTLSDAHWNAMNIAYVGSWSTAQNKHANLIFGNSDTTSTGNPIAAIGVTYGSAGYGRMDFHSFYNGGFKTDDDILMSINGNGYVGIGTTAPTYKLDVKGATVASGIRSDMGFDINPVPNPVAPTLASAGSGGSVDVGDHYYAVTYTTALGETGEGSMLLVTVASPNQTINLNIPVSTDPRVTGRKIYRTKAGDQSYNEYFLATVADNTTTTYQDTTADSSLTGAMRLAYNRTNTTTKYFSVTGTQSMMLDPKATTLGYGAGTSITTGGYNVLLGQYAGQYLTTGSTNTAVGHHALRQTNTGGNNTAIGYYSLLNNTSGSNNIGIGYYAGYYNQTGSANTAIGINAMGGVTGNSNSYNTALGYASLTGITTGGYNVSLGANSGYSITTGANNFFGGYNSGRYISGGSVANTTGANSVLIGSETKILADGDTNEIVIGYSTTGIGSNSVTLGNDSITKTALKGNVGIGTTSPGANLDIEGSGSTIQTLRIGNTTAPAGQYAQLSFDKNGDNSLNILTNYSSGTNNFISFSPGGTERVRFQQNGNVGIGTTTPTAYLNIKAGTATASTAPLKFTSGTNLTTAEAGAMEYDGTHLYFTPASARETVAFISDFPITIVNSSNLFSTKLSGTGSGVTTTTDSIFLGVDAGNGATGANNANFLGLSAGKNATSATYANFLGASAGEGATGASYSNFLGQNSGLNASSASYANFFGANAGSGATNASNSNFLGSSAGATAVSASSANFFGYQAGSGATYANDSNFFGYQAGLSATYAANSNFIGGYAGSGATSATYSNFFGTGAGAGATSVAYSNFFGAGAGNNATDASNSNFLGQSSGDNATNAINSNFFGSYAGSGASYASGSNFFGSSAGTGATNAFSSNFFGTSSGTGATDASNSNFLGYEAGTSATNASYSNFSGASAGSGATDAHNANFFGQNAGNLALSANNANFFGQNAGDGATNSAYSNFFGKSSGISATDASYSNFIGHYSGYTASSASNSNFIGYYAGASATTASNSIFIGKKAGFNDTVDNTANANNWSILIGYNTRTGGYGNSILLGGSSSTTAITNTKANQFMLADTITDVRWRGVEYTLPSAQGSANSIISNDGSGTLSWTNTPTLTSLTTPLILGGTGTTQDLTLQTTSGVGTTGADMHFLVGNNGATEAMTILNDGSVGIGATNPQAVLHVGNGTVGSSLIETVGIFSRAGASGFSVINSTNNIELSAFAGTSDAAFGTITNHNLRFKTNNVNRMIINTSGNVGIGTTAPDSKLSITTDSLGATQTNDSGIALVNNTSASDGGQQISPALRFRGQGWKTDATAESRPVDWRIHVLPIQAATNPSSQLIFSSSINNSAYTNRFTIGSAGGISGITAISNTSTHTLTRTALADVSTDGFIATNTTASTVGAQVQRSPRSRWSGTVWDTGASASRTTNFIIENIPTGGANPGNSRLAFSHDYNGGGYSELFSIRNNGNVGIGTTTPTNILSLGNSQDQKMWIENTATDVVGRALTVAAGSTVAGTSVSNVVGGDLILQSGLGTGTGTSNILFQTGTTLTTGMTLQTMSTKMTISGSGNVAIGTTDSFGKVTIKGTNNYSSATSSFTGLTIENGGAYGSDGVMGSGLEFTSLALQRKTAAIIPFQGPDVWQTGLSFWVHPSSNINNSTEEAFRISYNKNIGIGTTSPTQQLEITKNFLLPKTVGTTPYGIIYKGADPFIHDFNYGYNGTTTTVGENLFIGNGAGNFTMGSTATIAFQASYNVGVGTYSLRYNTTGQQNVAVGMSSSQSITTGSYNTAVGYISMANVSSGSNNSAFGMASMVAGNGDFRVAIGSWALSGGGGSYSTTVGGLSLMSTNSSATYNVGLGYQAGRFISGGSVNNTTGASSVFLGADTKPLADGDTNEIVIGYNTTGIGSNSVTLGNDSITKTALKGLVGIGTTNPTSKLEIYGSGNTNTTSSLTVKNSSGNTGLFVRDDGYTGIGTGTLSGSKLTVADDITIKGVASSGTNINLLTASAYPTIQGQVSNTTEWELGINNSIDATKVTLFTPNKKILIAGQGSGQDLIIGGGEANFFVGDGTNVFSVYSPSNGSYLLNMDTDNGYIYSELGNWGLGTTTPTAKLHIGTGGGGLAPLKFTSGVNLTIPEAGAMEYDGTNLYFTPSSTRETVAFISDLSGYQLRSQITDADLVSQSDAVYGWAHGTAQRGDEMFIGTRSSPATITVFTDPNDLSSYTQNTLTGYNNLESLTYDSINDKLYGYVWNNDSHLRILSINPNDLSFTQVFDSSTINGGGSAGITNDGTYVYVVTYTNPAKFVKIRISDWTVVAQNTWTNGNNGHALGLLSFDDRDELYATSSSGTSYFAKINPVDLSYSEVALSTNALTDDLSFNKVNNTYAYVYLGSEHADDSVPASSKMVRIKTDTMLADYFWGKATYVVKIIGDDLYSGSSDGAIIKYPNRDINNPKVFLTDGKKPNELFYAGGKIFFTDWTSSARVYEAEFPESYVVNGTDSYSMGRNAIASGNLSTAIGFDSLISGDFSYNIGNYSEVTGSNSIAIGTNTNVSVNNSIAIGNGLKVGNIDAQIINDVADSILIGSADSSGTTQNHIRFTTGGMTFYSGVTSESYISAVDGFFVNDEPVVVWGGNTLGAKKLIGTNDTYDIGFKTDNTERLTILSDGKVGINNSNPTAMLDIIASSNISPLTVSGNYNQAGTIRAQSTLNTGYSGMNMYDESGTLSASFAYGNTSANSFTNEFVFASRKSTTALKFYQGGVSAGAERIRIDASANIALLNAKVGVGTTAPATLFEIGSSDLGDGTAGPVITLGRNTNATNTGAGSINFLSKGGTAGYVWQDAAGNIRINTSAPSNANDTAGTVVGAQTSTRETKQDINDYTDYSNALSMIVNAPLHTFRYIKEVNGYGSESPLAKERIGFIADEVDPAFMVGNSIDQVSVNGILMAAIKEMDLKVKNLELNGPSTFGEYANIFFSEVVTSVESGVLYMKGLVVESIKVGSPEKRTGITLYDEVTGEPYCLSVANGNTKTIAGECGIITPPEPVENSGGGGIEGGEIKEDIVVDDQVETTETTVINATEMKDVTINENITEVKNTNSQTSTEDTTSSKEKSSSEVSL